MSITDKLLNSKNKEEFEAAKLLAAQAAGNFASKKTIRRWKRIIANLS